MVPVRRHYYPAVWIIKTCSKLIIDIRFPVSSDRDRLKKLNEMRDDPFQGDVQPLKGKQHKGRYRKRVGRYRIIFTPDHDNRVVEVYAILPRDEKTYW